MAIGNRIKKSFTAIIQARMTSKRLPEKSMRELGGRPMIDHVIERAKAIKNVGRVVLATSSGSENFPLVERARALGAEVFAGSEDNVLERYYLAAKEFGGDFIVRITADNPLTDPDYAAMAAEVAMESNADLSSISNLPLGCAVEIIKFDALEEAYRSATLPYHFEHVTPYIKEHNELFIIEKHPVEIENNLPGLRLTVDTEEDFDLLSRIYSALYKGDVLKLKDVLAFIKNNPELAQINSGISQRPMTHAEKKL